MHDSLIKKVLIIGGGVIGLSIARELHKGGVRKICLVEKGACGQEASWAAGGMLGPQAEADEDGSFFEMCSASRDLYPELAAEMLDETGIDIELDRNGTLYLAFTAEDLPELRERFAWQRKAGFAIEYLTGDEIRQAEPFISPDVREGLYFSQDWQVDNRKLLAALKRYASLNGIEIIENTAVEKLIVEGSKVVGAETSGGVFHADKTVLATGAWTSLIKLGESELPLKIEPVRGQIISFQTAKRLFRHVMHSRRGYLVPRFDGRILTGSTSEEVGFEKANTEQAAAALRKMASEIAPLTAEIEIADRWSGLRPFAMDSMPVIGSFIGIDGLTIATAHYRNGILLAPLTAKAVASSFTDGTDSQYSTVFGPDRFRLRGIGTGK